MSSKKNDDSAFVKPTPEQLRKFQEQIDQGVISSDRLEAILRGEQAGTLKRVAQAIMRHGLISPEKIAQRFQMSYSPAQLAELEATIPAVDVLDWCKQNQYIVMAGPPRPLSISDLVQLDPGMMANFVQQEYQNHRFFREETVAGGWLLIGTAGHVPSDDHCLRPILIQLQDLAESEALGTAVQAIYLIAAFRRFCHADYVNDAPLFRGRRVLTASKTDDGQKIFLGRLRESDDWCLFPDVDYGWSNPGLAVVRQPDI